MTDELGRFSRYCLSWAERIHQKLPLALRKVLFNESSAPCLFGSIGG